MQMHFKLTNLTVPLKRLRSLVKHEQNGDSTTANLLSIHVNVNTIIISQHLNEKSN